MEEATNIKQPSAFNVSQLLKRFIPLQNKQAIKLSYNWLSTTAKGLHLYSWLQQSC